MKSENRLTEGSIVRKIMLFAAPVFLGNLFQQLYNIADTLIVGRLLGNTALAAVSSTGSLVFLLISLFSGISMGAGVVISRYFGAKDTVNMRLAIHTNLAFGLTAGVLLSVVGALLSPQFLVWMKTPPEVLVQSTQYLRTFFLGSLGLVMYNTCTGIMQAVGDSRHPLQYLIVSSCLNVILDIVMIKVFKMGVSGAALATIISQFISMLLCLTKLLRTKETYHISIKEIGFHGKMLLMIIRNGLPSGVQNSIIALANVVVQSNINAFGEMAMAGCGAYSKVEGFGFMPINSFAMALTTFVGQNLGAKEYERAQKGAKFGLISCTVSAELIGVIVALLAPYFMMAFTKEPEAIAIGVERARICSLFFCLLACTHAIAAILRGSGRAVIPMVTMMGFWCILRVTFLRIMIPHFQSILVVDWVYPLTWALSTLTLMIYYLKADWVHGFDKDKTALKSVE